MKKNCLCRVLLNFLVLSGFAVEDMGDSMEWKIELGWNLKGRALYAFNPQGFCYLLHFEFKLKSS